MRIEGYVWTDTEDRRTVEVFTFENMTDANEWALKQNTVNRAVAQGHDIQKLRDYLWNRKGE